MKPFLAWGQAIFFGMMAEKVSIETIGGVVTCFLIGAVSYLLFIAILPELETEND